jgi:hypothetical protein
MKIIIGLLYPIIQKIMKIFLGNMLINNVLKNKKGDVKKMSDNKPITDYKCLKRDVILSLEIPLGKKLPEVNQWYVVDIGKDVEPKTIEVNEIIDIKPLYENKKIIGTIVSLLIKD